MTNVNSADPRRKGVKVTNQLLDAWLMEAFGDISTAKDKINDLVAQLDDLKDEIQDLKTIQLPARDEKIKNLELKNEEQERKIIDLENELKKTNVEGAVPNQNALFTSFFNNKTSEKEAIMLNKVRKELNESERIENNVIISNLKKVGANETEIQTNDTASVNKIMSILDINQDKIRKITRIKTQNTNANLILVEFKEKEYQTTALRNWNDVKSEEEFNNLFINKDKTKAERMADSKLRAERNKRNEELPEKDAQGRPISASEGSQNRKFYWGIRFGELKKIYKQ